MALFSPYPLPAWLQAQWQPRVLDGISKIYEASEILQIYAGELDADIPLIRQRKPLRAPKLLLYLDEYHLAAAAALLGHGADQPGPLLGNLADAQLGRAGRPGHPAARPHAPRKGRGRVERAVRAVGPELGLEPARREVHEVVARGHRGAGRRRLDRDVEARVQFSPAQREAEFLQLVGVEELPRGEGLVGEGLGHLRGGFRGARGYASPPVG